MYGPPVPMLRQGDGEITASADASGARRSIYLQVRRSQPLTLLQVFDQPVIETNCTRRAVSTAASQALTLLNSDFMTRQADAFAGRVMKEKPDDPAGYAVLTAFGRPIDGEGKGDAGRVPGGADEALPGDAGRRAARSGGPVSDAAERR